MRQVPEVDRRWHHTIEWCTVIDPMTQCPTYSPWLDWLFTSAEDITFQEWLAQRNAENEQWSY